MLSKENTMEAGIQVLTWFMSGAEWTCRGFLLSMTSPLSGRAGAGGGEELACMCGCWLVGSHMVLQAGHNNVLGPALQYVDSCFRNSVPLMSWSVQMSACLVSWWTCHKGPASPPICILLSSLLYLPSLGLHFLSPASLLFCLLSGLSHHLLTATW